ncbi:MAG: metallophosphoesterase [Oscillospiraceae bacterium]|nr:metallophosphoesterase [Oscillospiraceae bacterium]
MALYALGDTHLSLSAGKPMDVFGGAWENYMDKLARGLGVLTDDDTLVLCGDTSWAKSFPEARDDFAFLNAFPGRKLIVKGNHDYWWSTATKMRRFFAEEGFHTLDILHNNAWLHGDVALCGTRGWFYEEDNSHQGTHDEKVFLRECIRLKASLDAGRKLLGASAGDPGHPESGAGGGVGVGGADGNGVDGDGGMDGADGNGMDGDGGVGGAGGNGMDGDGDPDGELLAFLHYPPLYEGYRCDEIVDILTRYGVRRCFYGHLHGPSHQRAIEGAYRGIDYRLVSADYTEFRPFRIT